MKILGYTLTSIAFIDFAVSFFGIDFYGLAGINLTGWLYQYSPIIVGALGSILIIIGENKQE